MSEKYSAAQFLSGKRGTNWKGGRTKTKAGYVLIYVGKAHPLADVRGYVYEHRLKAWEAGQDVEGKHVHHDNENKADNAVSNLEALTVAEHRFRHRSPDSNRQHPSDPNRRVMCACECGAEFDYYDSLGRPRIYISGHNPHDAPSMSSILSLIESGIERTSELIRLSGLTKAATEACITKLNKRGQIQHVCYGRWRLGDGAKQ